MALRLLLLLLSAGTLLAQTPAINNIPATPFTSGKVFYYNATTAQWETRGLINITDDGSNLTAPSASGAAPTYSTATAGQTFTVTVTGVSLTATAPSDTALFTVPSGKTAVCLGATATVTAVTGGATTAPAIVVRDNTAGVNMTQASNPSTGAPVVTTIYASPLNSTGTYRSAPAGDAVVFRLSTANNSTSCTATVVAQFVYF